MFLVQVAQRHGVRKELVEIFDALFTDAVSQGDRQLDDVPEWLDLVRVLMRERLGPIQDCVCVAAKSRVAGRNQRALCELGPEITRVRIDHNLTRVVACAVLPTALATSSAAMGLMSTGGTPLKTYRVTVDGEVGRVDVAGVVGIS